MPSQSEVFSLHTITENISINISPSMTMTPSQREIFSEIETGSSSSEDMTHSDRDKSEEATTLMGSESSNEETSSRNSSSRTTTPSQSEIFSLNSYSTSTSSQSEIFSNTDYDANSKSSSRKTARPS